MASALYGKAAHALVRRSLSAAGDVTTADAVVPEIKPWALAVIFVVAGIMIMAMFFVSRSVCLEHL